MSQIQYLQIVIFAAIAAIAFGIFTTNKILSLPKGTKKMTTISSAIQEGAKAYLNRQYTTISIVGIVIFFAFFYTSIVFNPVETADNLKRQGGFIPGIRPGEKTAEYIDFVLSRITTIGALYLAFVCILPEILIAQYSIPFYLGGTSLLIVVVVGMDTVGQIQSHLFAYQYEALIKKSRLRGTRR